MERYLNEATWEIIRPLRGERVMACIETKSQADSEIRSHWLARLKEQGFEVEHYFQVNALRSFDRKLAGGQPTEAELDFPTLEAFLARELSRERIERIKRLNVSGLLRKTTSQLERVADDAEPVLAKLTQQLNDDERELARQALAVVEDRLFSEPHLWTYAFGREMGLRSKGLVGTCSRAVEALRSLPARLGSWIPGVARANSGVGAARLLANEKLFAEDLDIATGEISGMYKKTESDVSLALVRAGLDRQDAASGMQEFETAIAAKVGQVLRGPAREALTKRARQLTSWPVTLLADLLPLALILFSAYRIFRTYFFGDALPENFISLTLVVLLITIGAELAVFAMLARAGAWAARKEAQLAMRRALQNSRLAFPRQRALIEGVMETIRQIRELPSGL